MNSDFTVLQMFIKAIAYLCILMAFLSTYLKIRNVEILEKQIINQNQVPVIEHICYGCVGKNKFKYSNYKLRLDTKLDYFAYCFRNIHKITKYEPFGTIKKKEIPFHPKKWGSRLLKLVAYSKNNHNDELVQPIIEKYLRLGTKYMHKQSYGRFYFYPFEYEIYGRVYSPPWYSAIAQAYCLAAYVQLYNTTSEDRYRKAAGSIYESFRLIRNFPGQKEAWVSFVDDNQYLWFEEYPHRQEPQCRVLNGHVFAIMSLYSYYLATGNKEALVLIKAGITTVHRYFMKFRCPGSANHYCLLSNSRKDYKPSRSVMQMQWIADVTSNAELQHFANAFKTDMKY